MQVRKPEARSREFFKKLSSGYCPLSTGEKGFTLIEIIMIIVIAAIAIPSLLIVLGQNTKQGVNAELQITATNLAQALMEEIESKGFATATTYNGYSDSLLQYARTVAVCYVADTDLNTCIAGPTDYQRIAVTVSRTGLGSVQLVTAMTNY